MDGVNLPNKAMIKLLTVNVSRRKTSIRVAIRNAVQNVQKCLRKPQQIAEAVEPEVDEIAGQLDHLERELILVLIGEPHFRNHVIAQVVLDEGNGFVEPGSNSLLVAVRLLLDVVAGGVE